MEEEVLRLLSKTARLTSPGLLGTRLEHLAGCREDPDTSELLARAVAKLAFGEAPVAVLQALRTAEVLALEKDNQNVRPVAAGSTLRRLGLRALLRVKKDQISAAVGERQYGVGRKGGAQLLVQKLKVQAELRPEAVFIKVDQASAFQKMERGPAVAAAVAEVPELAAPLDGWYSGRTTHLW